LEERLVEEKTNLAKSRMTHAISPLENPLSIKETRKNVARINFELRNREIEG
jgi:large subunit ribosomal protein L29